MAKIWEKIETSGRGQAFNIATFVIIVISLDVKIVNVFVFDAIWVRLHLDFNDHTLRALYNFSGDICHPSRAPVPVHRFDTAS